MYVKRLLDTSGTFDALQTWQEWMHGAPLLSALELRPED